MPPLQAPPEDDDWDDGYDEEPRGSRAKWLWLGAAVVLLLVLTGGTWFLLNDGNRGTDGGAAGTTSSQTSAAPAGLELSAALIGRPADEVQAELQAAGLVVRQEEADEDALASSGQALDAGDVAALDPSSGFAARGTEVVLFVAADAFDPDGGGGDQETTPSTTAAPTTTQAAPTTTTGNSSSSSAGGTSTATTTTVQPGTEEPPPSDPPPVEPDPNAGAPAADGVE